MEVLGMITLRVSDDKSGRIRLMIINNDNKGLQLQVLVKAPGSLALFVGLMVLGHWAVGMSSYCLNCFSAEILK
jgi:hypothetical protein